MAAWDLNRRNKEKTDTPSSRIARTLLVLIHKRIGSGEKTPLIGAKVRLLKEQRDHLSMERGTDAVGVAG